jgi:hypothetical protein
MPYDYLQGCNCPACDTINRRNQQQQLEEEDMSIRNVVRVWNLVDRTDRYIEVETERGDRAYHAVEDGRELLDLDTLNLRDWTNRQRVIAPPLYRYMSIAELLETLAQQVIQSDLDEVSWCRDCEVLVIEPERVGPDDFEVCEYCFNEYLHCDDCDTLRRYVDYIDAYDMSVCEQCRDENWQWCDHCEHYYQHGDEGDHAYHSTCNRGRGADCVSPKLEFVVRNESGTLRQDEVITVSLPSGEITEVGIAEISSLIRQHGNAVYYEASEDDRNRRYAELSSQNDAEYQRIWNLSARLEPLGIEWQNRQGNYTKRLQRHAYKEYALKLPSDLIQQVGNLGREHSGGSDYQVAFTRDLNQPAREFFHEDSCWWGQSYGASRCALKSNGGYGMRSYDNDGNVQGRAWVLPLRDNDDEWLPTFETESPDAMVVFNGYGNLGGYIPARILAHLYGWTYRKIHFGAEPMYINAGGYLIASEEVAAPLTDGALSLVLDTHSALYDTERITERELAHV